MTISAKIIQDSYSPYTKARITTFELEYPRFIHCFDEITEVLCKIGDNTPEFMPFKKASEHNALIAQYDKETEGVSFVKANAFIEQEYSGNLVSFENQRLNFSVTDQHRLLVGSRKSKGYYHKEVILAKELAEDHTAKRFYKHGDLISRRRVNPSLAKLLAYFISDGTLPKTGHQAIFRFSKDRKIREVSRLLTDLDIEHDVRPYSDGTTNIVLRRCKWMEDCYDINKNKVLPSDFFDMDRESFTQFKLGLLESDGCVSNNEYNNFSEKLIDQLQALFTVNSCSFNKKQYGDCFKVKFQKEDSPIIRKDKHKVTKTPYNGKVYCVSVDTGFIFVRRKGIVHISGNCEFMTHRMISKNSASSRAIPVSKMLDSINENLAMPIHWGRAQSGMQASEENNDLIYVSGLQEPLTREQVWRMASMTAMRRAAEFADAGYHKQIVNRLTEPFQHMKVVATATDWQNFFWLRNHKDAQPEIHELARKMQDLYDGNKPVIISENQWHVPYVHRFINLNTGKMNYSLDPEGLTFIATEEAIKVSASLCAQVSYRKADDSLEKAMAIYKRLVDSEPVHASPFEHQAMCTDDTSEDDWGLGFTHRDRSGQLWSGNLRGWIQHRQLIPNNVKRG